MATPVDYEAMPAPVECEEAMTVPVDREVMPGPVESDDAVFVLGSQSGGGL